MSSDLGEVRFAKLEDMPYIVSLSKKESVSLGFIPKMAYEAAITGIKSGDRWSNVCNDKVFVIECNGDLVGFCLASFGIPNAISKKGKIAQICLQTDARKLLRGIFWNFSKSHGDIAIKLSHLWRNTTTANKLNALLFFPI